MHWMTLAQQSAPDPRANMAQLLGMIGIMAFMFYFALWRPQQKKAKELAAMLQSIKPGDRVVTSGGLCGVIVGIKDRTVSIRSADSKVEVLKSSITELVERAENATQS
jgi:preprotein translocase subunit YajC